VELNTPSIDPFPPPFITGCFSVLITGRHLPLGLYKGRAPSSSTAPLPALLLSSRPSAARTERLLCRFFTAVAWPPHCRPRPDEARDGLPVHPSPRCATSGEPLCPGAAARPSSVELCGRPWWSVHRGPRPVLVHEPWTESIVIFPLKCKSENQLSRERKSKNTPSHFPEIIKKSPQLIFTISSQL
jgi:hypothetical protein